MAIGIDASSMAYYCSEKFACTSPFSLNHGVVLVKVNSTEARKSVVIGILGGMKMATKESVVDPTKNCEIITPLYPNLDLPAHSLFYYF